MNDAETCLKLFTTWKRRYKGETEAKLKTEFKAYMVDMADN